MSDSKFDREQRLKVESENNDYQAETECSRSTKQRRSADDVLEELEDYREMKHAGTISPKEYRKAKKRLASEIVRIVDQTKRAARRRRKIVAARRRENKPRKRKAR